MKYKRILAIVLLAVVLSGCDNPYFNPHVSQATSLNRQTKALERIADALEKIANK